MSLPAPTLESRGKRNTRPSRYGDPLTRVDAATLQNGLSGAIYTASIDVDGEVGGLVSFDRRELKITPAQVQAINVRVIRRRLVGTEACALGRAWTVLGENYGNGWAGLTRQTLPRTPPR